MQNSLKLIGNKGTALTVVSEAKTGFKVLRKTRLFENLVKEAFNCAVL
jgi:hypothetical protein